ncbi:aminotransferase class I/II-fold pyridoxal phosphate-dependent enzyme [Sorangium sp. So ce429]
MNLSHFIKSALADAAPVTAMFRKLNRGADARGPVFNFALGQPSLGHSPAIQAALERVVADRQARLHQYPATSGLLEARAAVAALLSRHHDRGATADDIILTVGAAGALHVIFRTLLDPGDEVVTPAPFFLEYKYYCENYGARLVVAQPEDMHSLDVRSIVAALTPRTKLVLLNSPNNPAGTAYRKEELAELQQGLASFREQHGRELIVVSDETYHRVYYGDRPPASPWAELEDSILVGSFSKDLGLAGERVGYLALSPELRRHGLSEALALSQRVLGFLNAPLLWQRVLPLCLAEAVDVEEYRRKRDALAEVMIASGLEFTLPEGGVFILARSPIEDERAFVDILARHGVIVLPGRLYGAPGFVRATFSVEDDVIMGSSGAWQAAVYEALGGVDSAPLAHAQ